MDNILILIREYLVIGLIIVLAISLIMTITQTWKLPNRVMKFPHDSTMTVPYVATNVLQYFSCYILMVIIYWLQNVN